MRHGQEQKTKAVLLKLEKKGGNPLGKKVYDMIKKNKVALLLSLD